MAQAVHLIWGAYGLWLPRCPQSSWSDFVTQWELALYGRTVSPQLECAIEPPKFALSRKTAQGKWKDDFQPFCDLQREAISKAITTFLRSHRSRIWACAILPRHVQLVIEVSPLERGDVSATMRSEITRQLLRQWMGRSHVWAAGRWRQELHTDAELSSAISYVSNLYNIERVEPQQAPFVQSLHTRLICREEVSEYVIEKDWKMAG